MYTIFIVKILSEKLLKQTKIKFYVIKNNLPKPMKP